MVGLSSSDKPSQDGPGPTPENMCRPGCVGAPRRVFVVYAVAQYSVESPEVKRATETESIRRRVQCTDSIFYRNVTNSIISCPATHSQAIRDRERLKVEIWGWKRYSPIRPCLRVWTSLAWPLLRSCPLPCALGSGRISPHRETVHIYLQHHPSRPQQHCIDTFASGTGTLARLLPSFESSVHHRRPS